MAQKNSKLKILHAALQEFELNGYAGTSCDDIAGRAGVSKTLLFKYYGTKENILQECLGIVFREFDEAFGEIAGREDTDLHEVVEESFELLKKQRSRVCFIVGMLVIPSLSAYCKDICSDLVNSTTEGVSRFADQVEEGYFREFLMLMHSVFGAYIISGDEATFHHSKDELYQKYLLEYDGGRMSMPEAKNKTRTA
ncbi:TetR/AcrR family transcriptional regulator [Ruminococcaceae bacterium OttesenSCG-928-L11]|nr:TetR/AcrR family transcriptional regulator [Ruminococcaceae bacterium OttesenSCG-928-L11]